MGLPSNPHVRAAIGLLVEAVVFTILSTLLDRWAQPGSRAKPADEYRGSAKLDTDAAAFVAVGVAAGAGTPREDRRTDRTTTVHASEQCPTVIT